MRGLFGVAIRCQRNPRYERMLQCCPCCHGLEIKNTHKAKSLSSSGKFWIVIRRITPKLHTDTFDYLLSISSNQIIVWWAQLDSNQQPRDYEVDRYPFVIPVGVRVLGSYHITFRESLGFVECQRAANSTGVA
jgi:hypothetical protein